MTPVEALILNPVGSDGVTLNDVGKSEGVTAGDTEVKGSLFVKTISVIPYITDIWLTVKVRLTETEPPVFDALITTVDDTRTAEGVPDISPVPELNAKPAGNTPDVKV
jgi:hypothetical protein